MNLSLLGKPPEGEHDCVSFLSLGAMTGREVETGITDNGELSLTVKSEEKYKENEQLILSH